MSRRKWLLGSIAVLAAAAAVGWLWLDRDSLSDQRAEDLVREYNRRVIAAYRQADPIRVEGVTGPAEAKKLAGLIGAKADAGLTLDAELLDLQVTATHRDEPGVQVDTAERWRYVDRRIGDGSVQGAPSQDRYTMRYFLVRSGERWVVDHIAFVDPPVVGRAAEPAPPAHKETKP
ncbi:MAG: hypothetical protein HY902_01915 [Deltaproteobacteria bacterium]|nr:hypothetical protein [Deltaproteobacteria bacterium]